MKYTNIRELKLNTNKVLEQSEKYGNVAKNPCLRFNFPVGKKFALDVGYPKDVLKVLPESMYNSFNLNKYFHIKF